MKLAAFVYWLNKAIEDNPDIEQMELDYIDVARQTWYSGLAINISDQSDGSKKVSIDGI